MFLSAEEVIGFIIRIYTVDIDIINNIDIIIQYVTDKNTVQPVHTYSVIRVIVVHIRTVLLESLLFIT